MSLATADLSDAHPSVQVAEPLFRDFGCIQRFHGPVVSIKVFEDNALVRRSLEERRAPRGCSSSTAAGRALRALGRQPREAGRRQWVAGPLVYGCIRDSEEIRGMPIGRHGARHSSAQIEKGLHTRPRGIAT